MLAFHDLREDPVPFHCQKDRSSTPRGVQARLDITEGNHLKISSFLQKHNINLSNHPDGQRNYMSLIENVDDQALIQYSEHIE